MGILLSVLAEKTGLAYKGNDVELKGVNTLDKAGPQELSFLVSHKYLPMLQTTRAGAVLVEEKHAESVPSALVSSGNVYLDWMKVVNQFAKPQGCLSGVSDKAYIHTEAVVHETASVYPFAFIGAGAEIGPNVAIFPGCYVGEDCRIGKGCILYPNSVLMVGTVLGDNVILQPGSVLGADGYGYAQGPTGHTKIPQIGNVELGNNVEIGANSTIDRAALDSTSIGDGTKIDNLVMLAHNVKVGQHCLIISQVGVAGSTKIGDNVILAGQAGVVDNIEIGDNSKVGPQTGVNKSLPSGAQVWGSPAVEYGTCLKHYARIPKIPELFLRVKKLEKELEKTKNASRE